MTRANETTLDARIQRLQKRKQEVEVRLSREKGKLREQQRRERQRRLREWGELVELAHVAHVGKATLLGALLDVASRSHDDAAMRAWQQEGHALLADHATKTKIPTPHAATGSAI